MSHLLRWAGSELADVPLAAFYSGSILYTVRRYGSENIKDLVMAGFFAAFCPFTKNEGLAIIIITSICLGITTVIKKRRSQFNKQFIYLILALAITMPWLLFRYTLTIRNDIVKLT